MSESLGEHGWYVDDEKSVICSTLNGQSETVVNHLSQMTYKVVYVDESVPTTMTIDGEVVCLEEGMIQVVKAGVPYSHNGQAEMIVTARPPFKLDSVEILA